MTTTVLIGDCRDVLRTLPAESVHCVVTSPPYFGLRDYGTAKWDGGDTECDHTIPSRVDVVAAVAKSTLVGSKDSQGHLQEPSYRNICGRCGARRIDSQIGLEPSPGAFVDELVSIFREVRRVLRADGTLWLNLGDSYNNRTKVRMTSHQPALNGFTDDNWAERAARGGVRMSRSDGDLKEKDLLGVPWMVAFALRADGWYLRQDIIWSKPNPMPDCIKAGCPKGGTVLDPFGGAGTTALVADRNGCNAILIELNPEYAAMAERRIRGDGGLFADVVVHQQG